MKLDELQDFLDTAQIPEFKTKPKTFLEIARQPHYENVISNIYAFYLDPTEEHGLGDLFINSLVNCLNKKRGNDWIEDFTDFEIHTEYSTQKGRIDILLINDDSAIIIENKIYHHLNNGLREYSGYVENKIANKDAVYGLVLGLKEFYPEEENFVSLTHKELLNKVFLNLGEYVLDASEKYITFLKDFYQNIINLSEKKMNEQDLAFYLKNQKEISDIVKLDNKYRKNIKDEVEKVVLAFDDLKLEQTRKNSEKENHYRRYNSNRFSKLSIKVAFSRLFTNDQEIKLYIEASGSILKKVKEHFDEIIMELPDGFQLDHGLKNTSDKWYNLYEHSLILDADDISNLSEVIVEHIDKLKIYEAFKRINEKLYSL
ncbi:PD-(D/E)XK nuclease family protein [Psychroflexus planctonicus]|uniref:PD-(D/E)XK nuclease superfamily protein n=1 Tax=Psychroflexus planctonicus TaxID=1526575 RepID=A0ABQ1SF70_9FLAO|nr:PD-(D/E)XK nuclease family protein [Psychroflexus planctonicus]GGE29396.1 hypothetical protein GCM10010832_07400 [Psychroflexus planctonicus]